MSPNIIAQDTAAYHNILIGFEFFQYGYFDSAIHYYDKYLAADQTFPDAYYYKGSALWKNRQLDDALSCFNKAISMNPDDPDYYGERGAVYADMKEFRNADRDLSIAVENDPTNPTRYFNRGYLRYEQYQYSDAILDFSNALELRPDYITALKFRAECYLELNEVAKSMGDLTKIIDADYTQYDALNRTFFAGILADALISRAQILFIQEKFEFVIEDIDELIRLCNKSGQSYCFDDEICGLLENMPESNDRLFRKYKKICN